MPVPVDGQFQVRDGEQPALRQQSVGLAFSVVPLAEAALLVQPLWYLQRVEPSFRDRPPADHEVWLPENKYPTPATVRTFTDDVLRQVESLSGVRSPSTVNHAASPRGGLRLQVDVPSYLPPGNDGRGRHADLSRRLATLLETRGAQPAGGPVVLDPGPAPGAAVSVVNEAAAAPHCPAVAPLGPQLRPLFQPGAVSCILARTPDCSR